MDAKSIAKWTHDGDKVLIVKWVNDDFTTHNGFRWPRSGPVEAPGWNPRPVNGGGLHGWPWGLFIGNGIVPDWRKPWLVFAAKPEDVVWLGGQAKARLGEVVLTGTWHECLEYTREGREAWVLAHSSGSSVTGVGRSASAKGWGGSSSATGWGSTASTMGVYGSAVATGDFGSASVTGYTSIASATGDYGIAFARGLYGAAVTTGDYGAAFAMHDYGSASATGRHGAASATGRYSTATVTRAAKYSTVEAGPGGIAAAIGREVWWKIHRDAILVQRWDGGKAMLDGADYAHLHGQTVLVVKGKIQDGENNASHA